jgi:hypothetical protein
MDFDFNQLRNETLFMQLFSLGLGLFFILYSAFKFTKPNFNYKWILVLLIIVGVYFIFLSVSNLKYGFKLIYDQPNQTTTVTGEVEKITDLGISLKFYYNGKPVIPKIVEINGQEYYFMTSGDIEVQDTITITYLNESKFVLSVEMEIE